MKRWQFVAFPGPLGAESRGIVDLIAIRRDHITSIGALLPGDLFEIVLIQIKGGGAAWPNVVDLERLAAVRRYYRAKAVVLASWQKGSEPCFYVMQRVSHERDRAWREVEAVEVFGVSKGKLK